MPARVFWPDHTRLVRVHAIVAKMHADVTQLEAPEDLQEA